MINPMYLETLMHERRRDVEQLVEQRRLLQSSKPEQIAEGRRLVRTLKLVLAQLALRIPLWT